MPSRMNYFKEKLILKEEEKELKKMLEKFLDQQNRLKIEELALISMIKMEKEKSERKGSSFSQQNTYKQSGPRSQSAFSVSSSVTSTEMKNFVPVGLVTENASQINTEALDLSVVHDYETLESILKAQEEEEEEEEDSGDEEGKKVDAISAAESQQLMSFMDEVM